MSKALYILIFLSTLLSISEQKCKPEERMFDTEAYHNKTSKLKKNMNSLDSLSNLVGNTECTEMINLDSLFIEYANFCFRLENYDLPSGELITVNDCIVKNEIIDLKTFPRGKWFRREIIQLDSLLNQLLISSKDLKKFLEKDCVKKYNSCKKLKQHTGNQSLLQSIRQLVKYKTIPDTQFYQDSVDILKNLSAFKSLLPGNQTSLFYEALLVALIEDIKYRLSHQKNDIFCDNAHIRWSFIEKALITNSNECELEQLYELSTGQSWHNIVDSIWLHEQIDESRKCAIYPRGCMCKEAINFDPSVVLDNGTCIGCLDSLAINHCVDAVVQRNAPCIYYACDDRCYDEQIVNVKNQFPSFVIGRDSIIHADSLCLNYVCGCMNPCAENYDSTATRPAIPDICIGEICGCLDSTAVNYARRLSPDWAHQLYYNDKIVKHDSTLCIYTGCNDPCALNYDPLVKTNDGSCSCDSTSLQELEKLKIDLGLKASSYIHSPQALKAEFDQFLSKSAKKYSNINFRKTGMDLFVDLEVQEMKISSKGEHDGIPLGEYNFKPVNEIIDALVSFLNYKTSNLLGSMLTVKIVGEADAHPIKGEGIDFRNAGRPIHNKPFKILGPNIPTDIHSISQDQYSLIPDSQPVNLIENDKITDNTTLAFLRAFMVEQKIKDAEPLVEESRMLIGAKANNNKGKKYRRVAISMQLVGFYETMGDQELANLISGAEIDSAIVFFNKHGYPNSSKRYPRCPCISSSFTGQSRGNNNSFQ